VGRPPGRKNAIPYRSRVVADLLALRVPTEASVGAKELAAEARAILRKALRSRDPRACCGPRVLAAIEVLREVGVRKPTVLDLLADMEAKP
jgi:hypothetical protein